jgi:predicted RNA-binding protein YlxR (DUF448 family)
MAENNKHSVKKIPVRRCVGCGEHFPKGELVRVLRTPDGEVVLDLEGKKSGRGAYICKTAACLKKARKSRRIETSLECAIPSEVYDRMEEEISNG